MIFTIDNDMYSNITGDFLRWLGEQPYTVTVETVDGEVYHGELDYYDNPELPEAEQNEGWLRLLLTQGGALVRLKGTDILKIDL